MKDLIIIAKCLPKVCINFTKYACYMTMAKVDSLIINHRIAKAKRIK